ncbi:hypothetical protein [Shimia thalassica]|uniref:hypothetical protein n=1 Tax=Shimia thalassica TaxID=1715693 RepID=UPI0026E489E3|nr:hypothetical protein [Shimia thalassica]MDO6799749.1 hypothetical protein [Shimia thalassica]
MQKLTFPAQETEFIREAYDKANVVLEYGSGGSTWLAAQSKGKFIISVESDREWALKTQQDLDAADLPSPAVIYYADIGKTGLWGRPVDESNWKLFHRYPTAVWSEPYFVEPDLVLIDGRFRPACFATVCMNIKTPTRVLFDDYDDRPAYQVVERIVKPTHMVGRMAEFNLTPEMGKAIDVGFLMELYTQATYVGRESYAVGKKSKSSDNKKLKKQA